MKRFIKFIKDDLPLVLACCTLTASVVLATVNAICRYTLSHMIPGADAWVALFFAYTVYVGSAAAFKQGAHYGVDVFVNRLAPQKQKIVQALVDVIVLLVMGLCFWLSIQLTMKAGNKRFEGLGMSYIIYDMSAVIGFGYSIIYAVEFLIADIKKLVKKEDAA